MKPLSKISFRLFLFAFILNASVFNVFSQSGGTNNRFYVCMSDLGPISKSFMNGNNISNIPIFYTGTMDPKGIFKLDPQTLTNAIIKSIPDASSTGYAVIDWEGAIETPLEFKPENSPEYQSSFNEFAKAIQLAKKLRPNMKWGFFGMPFPPLDKRDTRRYTTLYSLIQMEDVIYPSMYIQYNTDNPNGHRSQSEKRDLALSYLSSSLAFAAQMNKPVVVFIWNRYYSAGFKQNSLQLISLNEFDNYAKEILALSYKGKKVDGLILWGADTYYYNAKYQPLIDEYNSSKAKDFDSYRDSLTYQYIKRIYNTVISAGN
jgi:hypothetical protein